LFACSKARLVTSLIYLSLVALLRGELRKRMQKGTELNSQALYPQPWAWLSPGCGMNAQWINARGALIVLASSALHSSSSQLTHPPGPKRKSAPMARQTVVCGPGRASISSSHWSVGCAWSWEVKSLFISGDPRGEGHHRTRRPSKSPSGWGHSVSTGLWPITHSVHILTFCM
jgi:hypothetical protein